MTAIEIRSITAEETRMLRHAILRPHQAPETLVFPGDLEAESLHVGVFVNDQLVGVASVVPGPMLGATMPAETHTNGWQLRGMATCHEFRRKGFGAAMVRACIDHVARHGGTVIWCNARTPAVPFYESLGFETKGDEFQIPISGPHFRMWREVSPQDQDRLQ